MAITWKNIAAPDLQTNFNKVDLGGGFSKIGEYLSTIGENQRVKEKEDITNTLISDLTRYTGKDGEESLGTLRSSGALVDTLTALGNKVDSKAVMGALLSSQDRLAQENQRIQATQEKDRLLAQKPYVEAADYLISQGDLTGARNYVDGLTRVGAIDNGFSAKILNATKAAEDAAAQNQREQDRFTLSQATGKLQLDEAARTRQNELGVANFYQYLQTGDFPTGAVASSTIPSTPTTPAPAITTPEPAKPTELTNASRIDDALAIGATKGVAPSVIPDAPPVPAHATSTFTASTDGSVKRKVEQPLVMPPEVAASSLPTKVVVAPKVVLDGTQNKYVITAATKTNVVDGDTVDFFAGLKGENRSIRPENGSDLTCRIDAINAPELGKDGYASAPGAEKAKQTLSDLINAGKVQVSITQKGEKDAYGRTFCQIEVEGNDVGLEMLKKGAVKLFNKYAAPEIYQEANAQAKGQGVGIYAPSAKTTQIAEQTARIQAVLSNSKTPKAVREVAIKAAETLQKSTQETNKTALEMITNEHKNTYEQSDRELSSRGLVGKPLISGSGMSDFNEYLAKAGLKPDAQDPMWDISKADQYDNIMNTILSKKEYQDLDAGIVMKAMKNAFVVPSKNESFKGDKWYIPKWTWDKDLAVRLEEQLQDYMKSNDYKQDLRVLEGVRKERKRVNDRLVEAQAQDLRNVAGAAYQYQNPRDKK